MWFTPRGHRLAQNSDRLVNIARRTPNQLVAIPSGQLHRTVAHPVYGHRCADRHEAAAEIQLLNHFVSPRTVI
jgi:hypothetical protein